MPKHAPRGHQLVTIMARHPRRTRGPVPPPSSFISFSEPLPAGDDRVVRIVFDVRPGRLDRPRRWAFFESHALAGDEVPDNLKYEFNTVEAATIGALRHLQPYWNDGSMLAIHGGVMVPDMPANVVITGGPGYRARIDAGLYGMDQEQLKAECARTLKDSDERTKQVAIAYDIPLGQQVHAFCLLYDKLPRRNRPKLHDFLDQMMPMVAKRRRQRHMKIFLIISSEDWPGIQAHAKEVGIAITGMESILAAARAFSPPRPRHKKVRTPLKKRYEELNFLLLARRFEEGRRRALEFNEEDDDDALPGSYIADDEAPVRNIDDLKPE
jgi:hypothetical protein